MSAEVTVYVVDDSAAVREGLHALLTSVGFQVEACPSAEAFLKVHDAAKPGVLILDIRLGGSNGLDLQEALAAQNVNLPVIIITAYGTVPAAVRAMRAGAVDVLQKPFAPKDLVKRVQQAISMAERHRAADARRAALKQGVERLTPREQEVLGLSFAGKTARQIAETLNLSVRTVETHRANILAKMGGRSPGDLADLLKGGPRGE
jgi:RNA polymerase sigma factor (sigma-70 family)